MDKKYLASLWEKSQSGDKTALELLCRCAEQFMRPYLKRKFSDDNLINDLLQETYIRLLNSLAKIREPMKFKNFVLKTTFHVVQDYFREKARNGLSEPILDDSTLSGLLLPITKYDENILNILDVKKALEKLPEKSQLILKLQSEGYRYFEIAEKLGLSESAVKMQIKRSFEKLQGML